MTKETLERGIQEIAADLIEDAKYGENAACEPASQAKHADSGGPEVRQIVSSRRPNGLKTVAAIAAALAAVVALSALALRQRSGKRAAGNPAAEGEGKQVTEDSYRKDEEQTFLAIVETNDGKAILVQGMEENGITHYRGEFRLSVSEETRITKNGETVDVSALTLGSTVRVFFTGEVLETYPMQIAHVQEIQLLSAAPAESGLREDRCELYLRVLKDLWDEDPGLNSGVTQIGVDLSELTDLTEEEKANVIQTFADSLGLPYLTGTWTELCDRGVIDREHLVWEDGLFFSVKTVSSFQWIYGIPAPSEEAPELMAFDAQKWRSGLGAIMFNRCIAKKNPDGAWTYTVGSHAIA